MYQGSQTEKDGRSGAGMNRAAVLLIAIILLISTAVGSTAAFLITKTDPVENTFEYASVSCEVTKNPETGYVQVKNIGTIEVYIRAVYVVNWLDRSIPFLPKFWQTPFRVFPKRLCRRPGM